MNMCRRFFGEERTSIPEIIIIVVLKLLNIAKYES